MERSEHSKDMYQPRANEFSQKYVADLMEEKRRLSEDFPLCAVLIDEAIDRIYSTGRIPGKEFYADVFKQKPLKVTQKVFVPVKQYPNFNFSGKILGPKGNSLRRLHEETQCKIAIKGRNSIRDSAKEEELRNSGDPKYAHFHKDLYLEISTVATPAEGYARIAYALAEIRKYIIPDNNDEVSQEQQREMMELNPTAASKALHVKSRVYKSVLDGKMTGSNGSSKYLNLIKKTAYQPQMEEQSYEHEPEEEVAYEYQPQQYIVKRPPNYEYSKVRPTMPVLKRAQPPMYATEFKRPREAAPAPYKPHPYTIFKKYH